MQFFRKQKKEPYLLYVSCVFSSVCSMNISTREQQYITISLHRKVGKEKNQAIGLTEYNTTIVSIKLLLWATNIMQRLQYGCIEYYYIVCAPLASDIQLYLGYISIWLAYSGWKFNFILFRLTFPLAVCVRCMLLQLCLYMGMGLLMLYKTPLNVHYPF